MIRRVFLRIGWRTLLKHPWQSVLMILGITLGVAVVVAVDLANASAGRAFDLSTQAVAGRATHSITGGPQGLDEAVYARLRTFPACAPAPNGGAACAAYAPVVSEYVYSPQLGEQPLTLLGVDPFAEAPFRDYLGQDGLGGSPQAVAGQSALDLTTFLTRPGALLISQGVAERYGLSVGQVITLEMSIGPRPAFIAGLVQPTDELARRGLEGLILADIATVQELTGRIGRLDRIDLLLPESYPLDAAVTDAAQLPALQGSPLGEGLRLEAVAARSGAVSQMTAAFRLNLTALSLLALLVGMFLIYNTMTFSVVQRRPLFGTLRCLGATQWEVFSLVMVEALLVGLIGAVFGVGLGVVLGQGAVQLVTQTINDLFFVVSVRGIQAPLDSLLKGALVGLLATLATAAPPAWEAASVPPRVALSRSGLETKARGVIRQAALGGVALMLLGGLLLLAPAGWPPLAALGLSDLTISFAATFAVVVGAALQTPLIVGWLMRRLVRPMGHVWGTLGRMAPRGVVAALSRTAIAVMALMVAVSVTIGVSLMVSSFRYTVITWLGETLQGDIYVTVPAIGANTTAAPLQAQALAVLAAGPGVTRVDVLRAVQAPAALADGAFSPVDLAAIDNASIAAERVFYALDVPEAQVWPRLLQGGVLISEPLMRRAGLPARGGSIRMQTAQGEQTFPVVGVFYDYASTQGQVLMALPVYRAAWQDNDLTAAALRLAPGADIDATVYALQDALRPIQRLTVVANAALRQEVLVIFDRTFAITGALQLLATVVAFIGILSALLSLELERQRELGILRAVGMTARQLWALVLMETGLMGLSAGLLSMPTGYMLSLILVYIINRRSFGWTLQMQLTPEPFLQALAVAVIAALLAGLYPAWRMGRMVASEALRGE